MSRIEISERCPTRYVVRWSVGVFAMVLMSFAFAQDVAESAGYAWGFSIHAQDDASFYAAKIPLAVYRSASDSRLRDLGIYNAAGDPVPRVLQNSRINTEITRTRHRLPIVPLYEEDAGTADDIRLWFEREADVTRIELNASESLQTKKGKKVAAYIVDLRAIDADIESLELLWPKSATNFVGRVSAAASDDLQNWTDVGSGSVADLQEDTASIVQNTIHVEENDNDFLQLRWRDLPSEWHVIEAYGISIDGIAPLSRESLVLESHSDGTQGNERIYELGGSLTIDSVRIVLPEPNTVITAGIYVRHPLHGRWSRIALGSHHHIGRAHETITSPAVAVANIRADKVRVVIESGDPQTAMQIEVGWRPETLLFLAQGSAPFTLAVGRADDAVDGFPQEKTYGNHSIATLADDTGPPALATIGPRYPLGGSDRLIAEKTVDWRKALLWAGLLLGVAFVGLIAIRLIREMKTEAQ